MKLWLANKWENLRDSFWFLPSLMVSGAVALSFATVRLDQMFPDQAWRASFGWTFSRGPEGSRAVLSAVSASMMTIASVTFSITIVALQLASTQFGPRLLRNFMRDRGNQIAIGAFIATFTYCLLVLRTVNGTDEASFVPHISVTVGLLLALASLGVLIFFIHHAAESIQAENVIGEVSRELDRAIDRLYPRGLGNQPPPKLASDSDTDLSEEPSSKSYSIAAPVSDYLQSIDVERIFQLAVKSDVRLHIDRRPGAFCYKGGSFIKAYPCERVDDQLEVALQKCFYFGSRRTLSQDIEFAINQLVEVAVRALSPGVNDPFTAVNCVDRLAAALCKLAKREFPSRVRTDDNGAVRVVTDASSPSGIIDACFDQIRQAAEGNVSLTIRLLQAISEVGRQTTIVAHRKALRAQADAIMRGSQRSQLDETDVDDIQAEYLIVETILGCPA